MRDVLLRGAAVFDGTWHAPVEARSGQVLGRLDG
jgi:hypothetical protein